MQRRILLGPTPVGNPHWLATENVARQETVVAVIAAEVPTFLQGVVIVEVCVPLTSSEHALTQPLFALVPYPQRTKSVAHRRASSRFSNPRARNSGRYWAVRKRASAWALSWETRGRE